MIRPSSVLAATVGAALILAAARAGAQPSTIRMKESLSGRLDASDPVLADGAHYDLWLYRGTPGERITITLRSDDFDAYLFGGAIGESGFRQEVEDDDSAGDTNSRLTVTVGADGSYAVRATSYDGGESGAYTLTVVPAPGEAASVTHLAISAGIPVEGRLDLTDAELEDGSYYDLYLYRGAPGERLVVTMRSSEFDAYLYGGRLDGVSFVKVDSDDDGGGGSDARLLATAGPDGTYAIRANSLEPRSTGSYTLSIERP